jgi:ferredoxin
VTPDLHAVGDEAWNALLTRLMSALRPRRHYADRSDALKVRIDHERCQGHGRCYDLAPSLFGADDEGYGTVLGDGTVPPGQERDARLAELNCPERAVDVEEA